MYLFLYLKTAVSRISAKNVPIPLRKPLRLMEQSIQTIQRILLRSMLTGYFLMSIPLLKSILKILGTISVSKEILHLTRCQSLEKREKLYLKLLLSLSVGKQRFLILVLSSFLRSCQILRNSDLLISLYIHLNITGIVYQLKNRFCGS